MGVIMNVIIARYWGRKPKEIIQSFISSDDYVIVDPFGGSGIITYTALKEGKKAIYSDINPYAWLVAHVLISGADYDEFIEAASRVLEIVHTKPVLKVKLRNDRLYYPNGNPFMKRRNYDRICDFFPKENMRMLWSILKAIDAQEVSYRTLLALYLTFCNTLFSSSYMKRENAGSWSVPCYWIPSKNSPKNPLEVFKKNVERLAKFFKEEKFYSVGYKLEDLNKCDAILLLNNALTLKYNSSWTIITDPPHLEETQYMELSFFYWVWLRESRFSETLKTLASKKPRFYMTKEIIVNLNRGMTIHKYLESIKEFIMKIRRVRKKVIIFHEEDIRVLDIITNYAKSIWGDVKVDLISIPTQRKVGPRGNTLYIVLKSQ